MAIPAGAGIDAAGVPNLGDQANAVLSGAFTAVGPSAPFAFRGPMNLALFASINTTLTTTKGSLAASVASATGLANGNAINSKNVPLGAVISALSGTSFTLALAPLTYPVSGLSTAAGVLGKQVTLPPGSNVAALLGATVTVPDNAQGVTLAANTTVASIVQNDIAASQFSPGLPGIISLSAAPTAVPSVNTPAPFLQFAPTGNALPTTGTDAAATFTGAAINLQATVQLEKSFDGGVTWIICNLPPAGSATPVIAQWVNSAPIAITFGEPEKNVLYRFNCTAFTAGTANYRISQTGGAAESLAIGPLSGG